MVLVLYGMPISQPARAVQWALECTGTPYNFEMVMPGKGENTRFARTKSTRTYI